MKAQEAAQLIKDGWRKYVEKDQQGGSARDYIYASQYRNCTRRMVYDMTSPEAVPPWEASTLARFKRGKDRERDLLIDLERIGRLVEPEFERVSGQEPFTLTDRKGRKIISGKVDARIRFAGDRGAGMPLEAKAWSPNITANIDTFADVLNGKWTRSGGFQTLMYLLGMKEAEGFLLLDKPGLPDIIPVELETYWDEAEEFWRKAEEATAYIHGEGELPDFIDDPNECKQCPFFGAVCNPPIRSNEGLRLITDEVQIQKIEHYLGLRDILDAAGLNEFKGLEKELKAELRGVEYALAGEALITGKWAKQSETLLPDEVKAEWDEIRKQYTRVNPKGKFTVKIEHITKE